MMFISEVCDNTTNNNFVELLHHITYILFLILLLLGPFFIHSGLGAKYFNRHSGGGGAGDDTEDVEVL